MSFTKLLTALSNDMLFPTPPLTMKPSDFVVPKNGFVGAFGWFEAEHAARSYIEFCQQHSDRWCGVSSTRLVLWQANRQLHQPTGVIQLTRLLTDVAQLLGPGFEALCSRHGVVDLRPFGGPLSDYIIYPGPRLETHPRLSQFRRSSDVSC